VYFCLSLPSDAKIWHLVALILQHPNLCSSTTGLNVAITASTARDILPAHTHNQYTSVSTAMHKCINILLNLQMHFTKKIKLILKWISASVYCKANDQLVTSRVGVRVSVASWLCSNFILLVQWFTVLFVRLTGLISNSTTIYTISYVKNVNKNRLQRIFNSKHCNSLNFVAKMS